MCFVSGVTKVGDSIKGAYCNAMVKIRVHEILDNFR